MPQARPGSDQAFPLGPLALQLAEPTGGIRGFAGATFRGFFVVSTSLHLAEQSFPLHLLLQGAKRLIDVVVTDEYGNDGVLLSGPSSKGPRS